MSIQKKRIVVIGGGTGTFTVLNGLKYHPVDLSAVVSIADNGGSTGILRDELGVLPPGDIRQCLVALSEGDDILRRLFSYRFHEGGLNGHMFGNLFLSALEKISGDPLSAIREAHRILQVKGNVIPVSSMASDLYAELVDGTVIRGEHEIDEPSYSAGQTSRSKIKKCFLSPSVTANPEAITAILEADAIIMGPGDLYTSLIPVLCVDGIIDAISQTHALKIYVMQLATKRGQTDDFVASTYIDVVNHAIAPASIDKIIVNESLFPEEIVRRYIEAGENIVQNDLTGDGIEIIMSDILADGFVIAPKGDTLKRSLLRHDSAKLASVILAHI